VKAQVHQLSPNHIPFPEAHTSHPTTSSIPLPSIPTAPFSPVTQPDTTPIRQYSRRARIAQSFALLIVADELASLVRDVSEGEACPTDSGFIADQDKATIAKSSTLPHDSAPKSRDDAPIKGRSINEGEAAAKRISNDSEEVARVLTSMNAKTVLAGGIDVPTGSDFIPMGSKEETKRLKRKCLNLEKEQVKKQKSSEEAPEIKTSTKEFTEEKMKEMMQPITHLLEKETLFVFSKDCIDAFETLNNKLTEAPILVVPDWNLPFKLMCDASDFVIGVVLGQRKTKHFQPIHYSSKTMTEAQIHYTTTEKEMLAVVYSFEKFWPYLVLSKSIVYTNHSDLKYLVSKQDTKPSLIWWVLLLQEFDIINRDKKGMENLAADHLSKLENPHKDEFENKDINENFPLETLGKISSGSTPWLADFVNFHARNFIIKGCRFRPSTITKVFPYGTVELSQPDGPNFKVNGHRVEHYFGGDVP
nr:reverse transcriptase domain-containing protein [Tanacetum cinerariifolium]